MANEVVYCERCYGNWICNSDLRSRWLQWQRQLKSQRMMDFPAEKPRHDLENSPLCASTWFMRVEGNKQRRPLNKMRGSVGAKCKSELIMHINFCRLMRCQLTNWGEATDSNSADPDPHPHPHPHPNWPKSRPCWVRKWLWKMAAGESCLISA